VQVIADITSRVEPTVLKLVIFIDLIAVRIIYVHAVVYISLYIVTDNCENLLHSVCETYGGPTGALSLYLTSSVQHPSAPTSCKMFLYYTVGSCVGEPYISAIIRELQV
jgi:hypothetical protein